LFDRITRDDGHLEILVNNAVGWGNHGSGDEVGVAPFMYEPPWHAPKHWWDDNFTVGVRSHWLMTNAAAPLFVKGRRGVVFFTSELHAERPGEQELVLDLRGTVVERMAGLMALHLRPHRVSSILLYPGFVRTDAIERAFAEGSDYFDGWTRQQFEQKTCSLEYVGRAAACLAADPDLLDRTGTLVTAIEAGKLYGFTDTNGLDPVPL
jgi:NAD(P)-dependent dehydrogenase (short-subunit alcohol dehydrogenase family)